MGLLFNSQQEVEDFSETLGTVFVGRHIEYYTETTSTNDLAKCATGGLPTSANGYALAGQSCHGPSAAQHSQSGRWKSTGTGGQATSGTLHGKISIADSQTHGRGRHGRTWETPPGLSLLFTLLFRPTQVKPADLGWIPLVAGLACAEGLETASASRDLLGGRAPRLTTKWPNDIVLPCNEPPGWKKMGGILCESSLSTAPGHENSIAIGIGLNINQRPHELPQGAKAPPISLLIHRGREFERLKVLRCVAEALEARLTELGGAESAALKTRIDAMLGAWWTRERVLRVELPQRKTVEGRYAGLDEFGRLKLLMSDGSIIEIVDGEIVEVV